MAPQPIFLINSNYEANHDSFSAALVHLHTQYLTEKFDTEALKPNHYWYQQAIGSWVSAKTKRTPTENELLELPSSSTINIDPNSKKENMVSIGLKWQV